MNELDFSGKVALVTGAGRGIGKGVALRLANHGVDIVVNDVNTESAEKTAEEIRRGRALSGVTGRKGRVGGWVSLV